MNLSISGRHISLSDANKSFIESSVSSLSKYGLDIISISFVVIQQKVELEVEISITLSYKGTVVVKDRDKDLYKAVDRIINRAQKLLRIHHDRSVDYKYEPLDSIPLKDEVVDYDSNESEIIPVDLELHKPLEIEDALNDLKNSNRHFLVFNDHDSKMRVIYKRKDGKFGLY